MFCSEVDGKYIGKQLYTTTVEEMENGGAEFQKLVKNSNRDKRDKNGRTNSGLYTYFLPAYKTMYWDENGNVGFNKYGKPDEVKARKYFMNRRAALQNNTRNLASFIRKNPFTLDESFWIDGDQCLYDSGLLNEQLGIINIAENIIERGNFVWLNGERDTKVIWVKDKHGHWEICWNFKNEGDVYKMDEVEAGTDQVIWSNDNGEMIEPRREQDLSFKGNIVQSMKAYADGELGNKLIDFGEVNRIIAIGSDRMMNAVKEARHTIFKDYLKEHVGIGSINSTMQCMMKEICAQCLQKHIDPVTGKETFVFSCLNQDQLLDEVDFKNLNERLKANSVLEKLSNVFLTYLLSEDGSGGNGIYVTEKTDSIMEGH